MRDGRGAVVKESEHHPFPPTYSCLLFAVSIVDRDSLGVLWKANIETQRVSYPTGRYYPHAQLYVVSITRSTEKGFELPGFDGLQRHPDQLAWPVEVQH